MKKNLFAATMLAFVLFAATSCKKCYNCAITTQTCYRCSVSSGTLCAGDYTASQLDAGQQACILSGGNWSVATAGGTTNTEYCETSQEGVCTANGGIWTSK